MRVLVGLFATLGLLAGMGLLAWAAATPFLYSGDAAIVQTAIYMMAAYRALLGIGAIAFTILMEIIFYGTAIDQYLSDAVHNTQYLAQMTSAQMNRAAMPSAEANLLTSSERTNYRASK